MNHLPQIINQIHYTDKKKTVNLLTLNLLMDSVNICLELQMVELQWDVDLAE